MKKLDLFVLFGDIIQDINQDCKINITGNIMGLGSLEYSIEGSGYGELMHLIYNAVTCNMQQDIVEKVVTDFYDTTEKKSDDGRMMEYEPMMMSDAAMME